MPVISEAPIFLRMAFSPSDLVLAETEGSLMKAPKSWLCPTRLATWLSSDSTASSLPALTAAMYRAAA